MKGTEGLVVSVTTVTECWQGERNRIKDGAFNAVAPFTREIKQTLRKADRCRESVVATYEQGSEDRIEARLFARHPRS